MRADNSIGAVLRQPAFAFLVAGQTLSQLGDKLHHMALIALVGATARGNTGGIELAKLSVVFTLPVVLFSPVAGALVDRWDKRTTMVVCDALRVVLVALIPTLYAVTRHVWPVYLVAFFVFLAGTFFNAAKMALIPQLVARDQLLAANSALTAIGRVATLVGIVGGGMIIGLSIWRRFGWSDFAAGFYMDAASYVVSVATLTAIVFHASRQPSVSSTDAPPRTGPVLWRHVRRDVGETMALIRRDPGLRFALASVLLLAVIAGSLYVVMTTSVQSVLGRGTRGVGYMGGLLAAGLILGSVMMGTAGRNWDKRMTIVVSVAVLGLLLILGSVFFSFAAFMPIAVAGGALLGPLMVSIDTLLHESAPPGARGVVFSTRDLVLGAAFMIWSGFVGSGIWLAGRLGSAEPYRLALTVLGGLICVAGVVGTLQVMRNGTEPRLVPEEVKQ